MNLVRAMHNQWVHIAYNHMNDKFTIIFMIKFVIIKISQKGYMEQNP